MNSRRFNRSECIGPLPATGRDCRISNQKGLVSGYTEGDLNHPRLLRCTLHFRDGSKPEITASHHWHPLHPSEQTLRAQNGGYTATLILWRPDLYISALFKL